MLHIVKKVRGAIFNDSATSYGFEGDYLVETQGDLDLINDIPSSIVRNLHLVDIVKHLDQTDVKIGDIIHISIDTSKVTGYYECLNDFIRSNKYNLPQGDFYIHEKRYWSPDDQPGNFITNYRNIISIINFLEQVATHSNLIRGIKEFIFQKPDKICSIKVDYDTHVINRKEIKEDLVAINDHVLSPSDKETRIRLFSTELINVLDQTERNFESIIENWDKIVNSYKKSYLLYLSEFSFEKIKTSSQEYFHELTDRVYSTIHKFSTYIFAIPIAYIFILRFFDFNGQSLAKDLFLLTIAILYFVLVWQVLLNNLSRAFDTIENDIERFLDRISAEESLKEVIDSLKNHKKTLIPEQKRKICIVRMITIFILVLTIFAFLFIHHEYFREFMTELNDLIG